MSSLDAEIAAAERLGICIPEPKTPSHVPLVGDYTLFELMRLIGYIVVPITVLNSILLIASHLWYRARIGEQRNIIRIAILPSFYGVTSLLAVVFYGTGLYLDPWARAFEIISVCSFYQYILALILPDLSTRDAYFVGLERQSRFSSKRIHDRGSLRWYKGNSALVYQAVPVTIAIAVIETVITATVCQTGNGNKVARIIIGVVGFLSNVLALTTILRVYMRLRPQFKSYHVASKFLYYKTMVFFILFLEFIDEIVEAAKVVEPTKYMSEGDFLFGIYEFITFCVAFIFSFVYLFSFAPTRYRAMLSRSGSVEIPEQLTAPDAGVGRYLIAALWPTDIARGVVGVFKHVATLPKGRAGFDYTGGTGVSFLEKESAAKMDGFSTSDSDMQSRGSAVAMT